MKVHQCKQGSDEWLAIRAGIPTASEFDSIITPKWAARKGQGVDTYLAKKLAERWLGHPLISFFGRSMEQGTILEDEARPWYELDSGEEIEEVGFITSDDGKSGCSPDGLFSDGSGIEIKCPEAHTHVGYLLANTLPDDYAAQVYGCMSVTDAPHWKFLSYCRGFPAFKLLVPRNEKIIAAIGTAVDEFSDRLESAYSLLVELNGGPPIRKPVAQPREPRSDPEPEPTGEIFIGDDLVDVHDLKDWLESV